MADQRLTDKSVLTDAADGDYLEIIDVSDTSANAAGTTKRITKSNLVGTPFAGAFTDLTDVDETTLTGSEGKVPTIIADLSTDPATRKIKFERLPTFQDSLGGNAIINGGIAYSGTGLTFRAWATEYIINGRYIDTPVSSDVTQTTADATHPRIDVFVVQITTDEPPVPSIAIVTGVAAASPIKPSIDLSTQTEISFRTIAAGATVGTAITEKIYDEDTGETAEWDITDTPAGANLADNTDPAVGTVAITLPAYLSDTIKWTKNALYTYLSDDILCFYIRITAGLTPKAGLQFKLKDSSTGYYYNFASKIVNLRDYGFVSSNSAWQLIQIPLTAFTPNTRVQTQYDELEIIFKNTPILELDWIVVQSRILPTQEFEPLILDPTDSFTGNRLKSYNTNNQGFSVEKSADGYVGYDVANGNAGVSAMAGFKARLEIDDLYTPAYIGAFVFGTGHSATNMRGKTSIQSNGDRIDTVGLNGDYSMIMGNSLGLLSGFNEVFKIEASSGEITAPLVTNSDINSEATGKVLVTKEWVIDTPVGIRKAEHSVISVTTSQTINLSTTFTLNVIVVVNPGLTLTIQLPTSPVEGQLCQFTTLTNTVTLVAGTGTINPTYAGAPTAGFSCTYVYHETDTTWYKISS